MPVVELKLFGRLVKIEMLQEYYKVIILNDKIVALSFKEGILLRVAISTNFIGFDINNNFESIINGNIPIVLSLDIHG